MACEAVTAGGLRKVQIRRVAFHAYEPDHFFGMTMKVAKWDLPIERGFATAEDRQAHLDDEGNYSVVPFRDKLKPNNAWAMPFVTGHRYRVHWGEGLDFTQMAVEVSERWEEEDNYAWFSTNFTDAREAVNFTTNYQAYTNGGTQLPRVQPGVLM